MTALGVMVGGAAGAMARYLVDNVVTRRFGHRFPYGTLVINVTGSALLGFLVGLVMYHSFSSTAEVILGTGFCGGYTTFSTFTVDTWMLADGDARSAAIRNVFANLLLACAAAAVGMALASI